MGKPSNPSQIIHCNIFKYFNVKLSPTTKYVRQLYPRDELPSCIL